MLIIMPGIISVGVASGSCLHMRMRRMPMHSDTSGVTTLQIYQYALFEINLVGCSFKPARDSAYTSLSYLDVTKGL